MTAIVGVLCKSGVVIGADSSATFTAGQMRTIEQPCQKIRIVAESVIVAGTGQIGMAQRVTAVVEGLWAQKAFQASPIEIGKKIAKAGIDDFIQTNANKGSLGALVAFPANKRPHLCEFAVSDFQPELKDDGIWYTSMGSAQPITDPFLGLMREVFWKQGPPSLEDGVFAVTWALEHAIKLNPGGVNGPIRVAVLEEDRKGTLRARFITEQELQEHIENIEAAKEHLRSFKDRHQPEGGGLLPEPPKA